MNENYEQDVPLNWARRAGRPGRPACPAVPAVPRIPRITRLMALAIKFQGMVDRGEVRDYADVARLGVVTRARLTQIMNLLLLAPEIQEEIIGMGDGGDPKIVAERHVRSIVKFVLWDQQRSAWRKPQRIACGVASSGR